MGIEIDNRIAALFRIRGMRFQTRHDAEQSEEDKE
jgi:hypothetical protein